MNRIVFIKELKRNRKNFGIWTGIVLAFTMLILSIYPSFSDMGKDLVNLMAKLPKEYARAFGMDEATWNSIIGFYSTYFGIYITLLIGIFTASTGATILGKEERDGTAEFLLTRPVSRSCIFYSKMAALGIMILLVFFIQTLFALTGILIFSDFSDWSIFWVMQVHGFFLVTLFTGLAIFISSFLSPKINFMGMVVGMIFGTYLVNAISKTADKIEWIGFISPYHYLNLNLDQGSLSFNPWACFTFFLITLVLTAWAKKRFLKKDILN